MSAKDTDSISLNENHTKALLFLTAVQMLAEPSPANVAAALDTDATAFRRIPKMCFDYFGVRVLKGTVTGQRKQIFMVMGWGIIDKDAAVKFFGPRVAESASKHGLALKTE